MSSANAASGDFESNAANSVNSNDKSDFARMSLVVCDIIASYAVPLKLINWIVLEKINEKLLSANLITSKDDSDTKMKCTECRKRLSLSNRFTCKCKKIFCSNYKYADMHSCSFDHKTEWKKIIEIKNPVVISLKIEKI